ncbi:MAG TPA: phosphatase PAP2-related protein [Puia sp.]|jgi:membrane-associated phospholipid phosphatase|nr:phosphatase PAP2-related protein [Puia sp.]
MPQTTFITLRQEWHEAWQAPAFRRRVIAGVIILLSILSSFPVFFQHIERRQGVLLNDPVLRMLAPHNVSLPLFIVIWAISGYSLYRAAQTPQMFLNFLWSFILLSLFRTLTITLIPLDPPTGLIPLMDPLSNFFYGDKFVTKDLFFSGHTSTVFLLFLVIPGRSDKKLALLATFIVATLLLVQHVHYSLDVLGGFLFAWLSYWIATRWILR